VKTQFLIKPSKDDLQKIKDRAASVGMNTGEFFCKMALNGFVIKYNDTELKRLVWEINKIGVNINQVVKLCNEAKYVSPKSLIAIQQDHTKVTELLEVIVNTTHVNGLIEFLDGKSYYKDDVHGSSEISTSALERETTHQVCSRTQTKLRSYCTLIFITATPTAPCCSLTCCKNLAAREGLTAL